MGQLETDLSLLNLHVCSSGLREFSVSVASAKERSSGDRENIRVNQDCSLRRQAEEVIVVNPVDPDNLLAGQNDSRIGFNHCGYDFSNDGGKTWGDLLPPFWQFFLKDGHTADLARSAADLGMDSARPDEWHRVGNSWRVTDAR
jgi:hypothetical protein